MSRNLLLNQASVLTKAHRATNGNLHQNYLWNCNVIFPKSWYCRKITDMTNMPFESTTKKVVMKSYDKDDTTFNKITILGTKESAVASTFALLAKGVTKNVCMIDVNDNKLKGEEKDLAYGSPFLRNPRVVASKEHTASAGSKICVVAVGTEQGQNESEFNFTSRNTGIVRAIIPQLLKYSPEALYLIATEPVDVMTYHAWQVGCIPKGRVMGTGTNLDSARFRYMMGDKLGVDPSSCVGVVVGRNPCTPCEPCERGPGGVPVWSQASASGVRLMDINPKIGEADDPEHWKESYDKLLKEEQMIRKLKGGYTWALALSIANICEAILTNSHSVLPVSTYAKGEYSITEDVFVSLPCVLGINGVVDVMRLPLTTPELTLLRKDARAVFELQEVIKTFQ